MGAYNTVKVRWRDPRTGQTHQLIVQFKYGDAWQHEYQVGDELKWGGNDKGQHNVHRVVVDGALENIDVVPEAPTDFEVHIIDNRIAEVRPASGRYDFVRSHHAYIILDE